MEYYKVTTPENIDGEVWKTHPVFTEYEGSSYGRIRAKERCSTSEWGRKGKDTHVVQRFWKAKICVQHKAFNYLAVSIRRRRYFAHRFICECWYGMAPDLQVDHCNENKYDNRPQNLRWVTVTENVNARDLPKRARVTRKKNYPNNEWCKDMIHTRWKNQGGTIYVYVNGTRIIKIFEKKVDAAKFIGTDPNTVTNRYRNKIKDSNGCHWLIVNTFKGGQ